VPISSDPPFDIHELPIETWPPELAQSHAMTTTFPIASPFDYASWMVT
jgi:hypothetical protein